MAVTMAFFTRDLRVHDNPVLVAAAKNGGAVLPVFIVDDAIAAGNYLNPNKAGFLAAALAGLDDELRRRGGRLTVRHGPTVAEVERMVVDLSITGVQVASDVSGYAQSRERRLRDRLAARGCRLEVHSSSVTVAEPGELTPLNGQDHFAVFTPYYRKWNAAGIRRVLPAPTTLNVPDTHGEPLREASQLASGSPSPKLAVGGETTARQLVKNWLVDGDVASNQLNWQWVAGTGTDIRPYRVLNPLRQAERFDPDGDYVRRWVPELAHITSAQVHTPWQLEPGAAPDYPDRIVDHHEAVAAARISGGNPQSVSVASGAHSPS